MRNISAWAIRNPVIPARPVHGLLAMGLLAFMRMDVNLNPDISAPAAHRLDQPAGRRPAGARDPDHPPRRSGGARHQRRQRDQLDDPRRQQQHLRHLRDRHAGSTAPITDVRDAIARIRGDLPDGILEPQVERVDFTDEPIGYFSAESTAMTRRAAELVHRRPAEPPPDGHRGRVRGQPHRRRQPRDPGRARSGADAGAGRHRLADQPAAARDQHERRRRPRRDRRLRAVGARARQRAHRPRSSARPRSRSAAAARSGSTPSPTCATNGPSRPPTASRTAARCVSFMIQKAKGYSDVTVYHAVQEALHELRARGPAGPLQPALHAGQIYRDAV